ncbi:hypothetical protein [Pseudobacteroides cellulosolvens]|nr:hypothetical protein [Pseudobacteroides cellulosolvens]
MVIATSLGLPNMQPTIGSLIILAVASLMISAFTVVIACLYSVIRVGRLETYIMISRNIQEQIQV